MPRLKNINFIQMDLRLSYSYKISERRGLRSQTPLIANFWLRAWLLLLMGDKLKNE